MHRLKTRWLSFGPAFASVAEQEVTDEEVRDSTYRAAVLRLGGGAGKFHDAAIQCNGQNRT